MTESSARRNAVLASPIRTRIMDLIRDAQHPLTAQQLAAALSLHVTTVRFHLDQLAQAGLVLAVPERASGRGRPRIGYRPGAIDTAEAREQMIDALAEVMVQGPVADAPVEAGHRWADRLPLSSADAATAVTEVFTQLGFAPEPVEEGIRLRECPFGESAARSPDVVCRVHLGLAQGIAAQSAGGPGVDLIPFEGPDGCLLKIEPINERKDTDE